MPFKTGSRERLYGWKPSQRVNAPFANRQTDRWEGYQTNRWRKESRAFRQSNPLCAECKRQGRTVGAEVTDHIIPALVCPDPWDKTNWQPLCKSCNAAKGNEDRRMINEMKKLR